MIFLIILFAILAVIMGYIMFTHKFHEVNLPDLNLDLIAKDIKNVLFIYPHPDDEVMSAGGLIYKLAHNSKYNVNVISITPGEHGDEKYKLSPEELAKVRKSEFTKVMKTLGIQNFEVWDFVDGGVPEQEQELVSKIENFVESNDIQLLISFEKLGLYGHPDHISLSKCVNEVATKLNIKTLYSTLPYKILSRINLPKTLTYKDRVVEISVDKIADPEFKINITSVLLWKYLAARHYKSQVLSSKFRPLWLTTLLGNYEYYTSKYE